MRTAIAFVLAVALLGATYVAADGFAVCVFQGSEQVSGYFTFQQAASGSDVTVVANFTSKEYYSGLYLHFHTYGDLDLADGLNECWSDVTVGPYAAPTDPHYILDTSYVSGINLFDNNSIIGRRGALYVKETSCASAVTKTPIAECVFGLRNVAAVATNTAGQYLDANPTSGYAKVIGTTGQYGNNVGISGHAFFVPTSDDLVYVSVHIEGLAANTKHAIHVHIWGDISGGDALSAGLHLNPYDLVHGYPPNPIRHMGDMGNITTNALGVAHMEETFDIMSLTASVGNLIGRALVLHTLGDDGNPTGSVTSTGSAGGRLAKAVIGISTRLPDDYSEAEAKARIAARKVIAAINTPTTEVEDPPALAEAAPEEAPVAPAQAAPVATAATTVKHRKTKAPQVLNA